MPAHDLEHLKKEAQRWWEDAFVSTPYSSFLQMDYLVTKSGLTWEAALKSPKSLKRASLADIIKEDKSPAFIRTWWTSGRCTSFAIRAVRQLQEHDAPSFDFKLYDLGHHRVARCAKTGILIDSSSAVGVIVVQDGHGWVTLEDDHGRPAWKWANGTSKFERDNSEKERLKVQAHQVLFQYFQACLSVTTVGPS